VKVFSFSSKPVIIGDPTKATREKGKELTLKIDTYQLLSVFSNLRNNIWSNKD
jgi:hypothetical protein